MNVYRYYYRKTRITVVAPDRREANERYKRICQNIDTTIKRAKAKLGHDLLPVEATGTIQQQLDALNAFDLGWALRSEFGTLSKPKYRTVLNSLPRLARHAFRMGWLHV